MIVKMAGDRMAESKSNEIIVIGKMDHTLDNTHESANRVYSKDEICPTIPTCAGGNIQPKIIDDTEEKHQDGLFPTITAGNHGYANPHICTKSKETDSERFFNQALETFVENDCEPGDTINAYNKTVDKSGLCSTLTTRPEGFKTAILPVVENNNSIKIKQATKQGYIECKAGVVADFSYPESKLRRGRVQGGGDVSPTLTSSNLGVCKVESCYRIRKLTPRECWRLMGFSDEDFDKAAAVNSNTQLYKQAGNSIVKNVLMAIFGKMVEQGK